jgi:hypothetical protein
MESLVSRNERASLLVVSGFISLVSITNLLAIEIHKAVHPPAISFAVHGDLAGYFPIGHLITACLFAVVLFSRRGYVLSLSWTVLALAPFVADLARAYLAIVHNSDILFTQPGLNLLWIVANPFDYLVTLLLLIFSLWQLSIIVRRYVRIESD